MHDHDAKTIFLAALELQTAARARYLDTACAGDAGLRERVDALLAADAQASEFLGAAAVPRSLAATREDELAGQEIGRYRLVERIGEGGFGTVWRAEQQSPVRREVAVKIVRRGMDSRTIVARFDQERQALAVMDHPNIARIFDGGETEAGRPYFAMELVRGVPITRFCDEQRLDADARLRLFVPVCQAMQHAHQKGVIHRDIKPSNVLVEQHDGIAVPKVIDFGIAKALHQPLTDKTLVTEVRQLVGTPDYMAPEQADPSHVDVDTRADVYSLGVLLYELLTGSLPFDAHTLHDHGLPEMLRVIREVEPPKPSTRIRTTGAAATPIAQRRNTDVVHLGRRLRGDLDWIVMKALEKDRTRRYATAQEFAADVERHLAHEPVLASPPSFRYRARKLLRRHRGPVVAAAVVLLTLVGGILGTTWFAIDASRQAAVATARKAELGQLQVTVLLDRAVAAEAASYDLPPEQLQPLTAWLRDYEQLVAKRPGIERTLQDLRQRALPGTAEELARDQQQHPQRSAWERLGKELVGERRAQAVREGAPLVEFSLRDAVKKLPPMELGQAAWERVAPKPSERRVHGQEDAGLALVNAALAQPDSPQAPRHSLLDTLAWALLFNGRDEQAQTLSRQLVDTVPAAKRELFAVFHRRLTTMAASFAGERGRQRLRQRELAFAALTLEVQTRRTYRFDDPSDQFLHDELRKVLDKLDAIDAGPKVQVQRRLRWAAQVDELTTNHPLATAKWAEAAAAVAAGTGPYHGCTIVLRPQRGLVPIGANPVTGLWEFYDLRSAWDGESDPATIAIPRHDAKGRIEVADDTGIVFVLLPGGTTTIGAQRAKPSEANYDPEARGNMGPVRTVELAPFFLARHELTQGQWARLWTRDPSLSEPSHFADGFNAVGPIELETGSVTYANPVELVDWRTCDGLLRHHGLMLPSVVEWEYGCRAGATTPWSCPQEALVQHANLADATAKAFEAEWPSFMDWSDGCVGHVHVGHFAANHFGLHDMHGNVWEWCRDGFSNAFGPHGEPLPGEDCRGIRGGGFDSTAAQARSAFHRSPSWTLRSSNLGLRAARALQP